MSSTPAIELLEAKGIPYRLHSFIQDSDEKSFGKAAAAALEVAEMAVLKTLIVDLGERLVVGLVPVNAELDLRILAQHFGAKRAALAHRDSAERSSGYVIGGISPLGQRRLLATVIDDSVEVLPSCFVSAGRRGLEVELSPGDLAGLTNASFAPIRRPH